MENDHCITVTHFINPHLFWYKIIGGARDEQLHVLTLEEKLQELYRNKPSIDHRFRPLVGDKVAVNYVASNKYIRAEILQKAEYQQEEFIVWAIDYGFPLLTKKEYLRILPTAFVSHLDYIQCGGMINIEPGEQEYNIEESDLVMIKRDQWLQKPCDMLEKLLADACSINFIKKFETSDNHQWGDLIITNHKGHTFNAREYLLKTTHVIEVSDLDFRQSCLKLKTTNIAPWLSNDRNTKLKFNSIKHNYAEHSKQINSNIVKRKVEDWQARNLQIDDIPDLLEVGADLSQENTIDDITFDDSVSVINDRKNYIGKAGALLKIKQNKYGAKNALPPPPGNAFEIDPFEMDSQDLQVKAKDAFECSSQRTNSSVSSSTNISIRLQKLAELRVKHARAQKEEHLSSAKHNRQQEQQMLPLNSVDSIAASTDSSGTGVSMRLVKLQELRKKHARSAEETKKLVTSSSTSISGLSQHLTMKEKQNHNETLNTAISHQTTLNSYSYHTLEQTSDSLMDKTQDTKSELSVKNPRAKQLSALRKKLRSQSSNYDTILTEATVHESPLATRAQYKESLKMIKQQNTDDKEMPSLDNIDFKLKPKISCTNENTFDEIVNAPLTILPTPYPTDTQSAYEGLTVIPAGFDIARLQTYRDEKNHWHRKKTTRYDRVPHDQTISSDEFLINHHDQSSSSSDLFQMKPVELAATQSSTRLKQISSCNNDTNILNSTVPSLINATILEPLTYSQQCDSTKTLNVKGIDDNFLLSEVSTTTNSTVPSVKIRKRRQLQSPTSQLTKIDQILLQHDIEKKLGNKNILDLKRITCSPLKSIMSDNTSTDSLSGNSTAFKTRVPDKICNEKRLKEVSNYTTLMEVKHTEHLPIIEGERNIQTKFIDHLVLAHSRIPLTPIENVDEAPFLPEILEEMRNMRVTKVYRIQVYSWSHVQRGNSLFVVNPSKTGKTWSYLPPLCSLVCYRIGTLKPTYGPVAIILVASSRHVELVYSYCRRLMCGLKNEAPTCVPSYGMRNFIETKVQLLNGCGILVTTPSSLLRLLHDNDTEPLFDPERLQHIVIDDMDLMLSRAHEDFKKAVRAIFQMSKKSKYKTLAPQLIVTSRDWDGLMVGLISKSNQPLLLIGDFLEAAVYGRTTLSVKLKSSAEKNATIHKFIKNNSKTAQGLENRIIIMCNEDDDVTNVMEFLQECGYPCLGYFNRSTDNERVTIDEWNNKVSSQILVCTDARFRELKVQNVQNLIHYSMPTSWTQFTRRFSALARTYENFVAKNFEQPIVGIMNPNAGNVGHSMILLDEENSLQLPRLVDFLLKHHQAVPEEILAVSKRVLVMREETRIAEGSLLCPYLLEFGECDETRCDNRHQLTSFDVIGKNDDIPCAGEMRLHILKVFSPTYYTARLLQHKPPNSTKWLEVRRSSEVLKFTMQLNMHYRNEKNLSLHWPPHLNDLCIYNYAENFRRARILFAPPLKQKNTNVVQANLKVTLKLIDDGSIITDVKCMELFVCDDKFKDFPAQAIDIRLMKIVPFDNERSWDVKTTKQIQKWIMDDIKPKYVIQASINFALANTIWVNNIVVMEKLSGINAYSQVVHLKKSLIEKNFATIYMGDRKHVREIAEENGLLNIFSTMQLENDDSDLDYQSCHNDSTNLIKFSSSNDEATNSSMESAKSGLEEADECDKAVNLQAKKPTVDKELTSKVSTSKDVEDWDVFLDDGQQREEVYVPLRTNSNQLELPKCNETNANEKQQFKESTPIEETWSRLPLNELVKVEIGDEGDNGNWENIFLQIIDKKSMKMFDDLQEVINKHVDNIKANKEMQAEVHDFQPLHNCIVKYNNLYLRAKVHGVFGTNPKERLYRFFLCDYACFTNAKAQELYNDFLYPTNEEILTFMPYQSIHTTLVGIQWDRFTKRYQVTKEYLYACAILERSSEEKSSLNLYNLPIHSYKILMYECEIENDFSTAVLFNKILLDNGITVPDEATKNYLEYEIGVEEVVKSSSKGEIVKGDELMDFCDTNNKDSLYSYEQFFELAQNYEWSGTFDLETEEAIKDAKQSLMNTPIDDVKINKYIENPIDKRKIEQLSESEVEEQGHCTSDSNSKKSSISLSSSDNSNYSPLPPPLKNLHKRPLTTWYENDCIIFLSINAPGVKDYLLEVQQKSLLFAAETEDDELVLHLRFLGSVDCQYVSHEIKGLNVVVRLVKIVFEKWPRLLEEPIKYSWLKYNFDAFDSKEIEYIMPQQRLHTVLENNNMDKCHNDYDDDSDSERDVFTTYNPIQNDDDCDPFS